MGKIAFLFAGQGAQAPGMGRAFYESSPAAARVFDAVEAARPGTLEQCFEGDADRLTQTINAQPCLFAADLACAMAALEAGVRADAAAGFSLGELCAVAFGGVVSLEDAIRLVLIRAEAMQRAGEAAPGSMIAVLKLDAEALSRALSGLEGAWAVNYNCPGQIVVACLADRAAEVTARVKQAGGRCIPLKVGGSFHTPLMAPATRALTEALADMDVAEPRIPVYADLTGGRYAADTARDLLSRQASSPVKWQAILENLWARGADTFIEFGPGTTLQGFVKRTLPQARAMSVSDPAGLAACLEALSQEENA